VRHLKKGRRLNRNQSHRTSMFRNMAMALFRHERIITTVAKAKEARGFIERLITLAKKNTLHARRLVLARLGTPSKAEVNPEGETEKDSQQIIIKLFTDIAPRYATRPGGYTRVLKRHERRLGDAGETAFLELVKPGETRKKKKERPAPAPVVAAPTPAPAPAPTPAATSPPPETPPAQSEPPPAQGEQQTPPASS
jgi:large subunit ribosomal protein L17